MNIVIPMAGLSQRFKKAGYTLPKYMLYVYNKSLFYLSVFSFKKYFEMAKFIFIIRNIFSTRQFVEEECEILGIQKYQIICLETTTKGQAETVYVGLRNISAEPEESILIFNIDTIRFNYSLPEKIDSWDGYLETFKGSGKNWSYAKVLPDTTQVIATAEKKEISDNCSTGIYFFKKIAYFYEAYDYYHINNLNINEYYVAPLYNYLIKQGKHIHIQDAPKDEIIFCGIPEEYVDFVSKQKESFYGRI
jgi:hypothetical protein